MEFTIFWSHPIYGSGVFSTEASNAEAAGAEAGATLPENMADEETDELEISMIRDDLDIEVWPGAHTSRPANPPAYVFE